MAAIIKRGKIYYLRLRYGGRETWISTNQTSERAARRAADRVETEFERERQTKHISGALLDMAKQLARKQLLLEDCPSAAAQIENEAIRKALDIVDSLIPSPSLLASELWEKYLHTNPDLKPSTLTTKSQRFGRFVVWAGTSDMRDMNDRLANKFLDSLSVAAQTRNNYISELSSVWKASPQLSNPWTENLRQKARNQHKRPFTRDQVRALMDYCQTQDLRFWHTAIMLAYYTGLRLKDVVMFRRDQITPDGFVDLIPEKTERTQKRIRVPANSQLREELAAVASIGPAFFPEQVRMYQNDRSKITNQFRGILDDTGMYAPGYGFHSLRHTFVTEALNAGIDIKQVQLAVGHETVELTEGVYYHGKQNADFSSYPTL